MIFLGTLTLLLVTAGDLHVVVDPIGYRLRAEKVCVLRQPIVGWDSPDMWQPGLSPRLVPRPWFRGLQQPSGRPHLCRRR